MESTDCEDARPVVKAQNSTECIKIIVELYGNQRKMDICINH